MRDGPSRKLVCQKAQRKCLSTNACRMGNKQEELEATMCLENNDLAAIRETRWDESHNWRAVAEGRWLFRRDRQGRRGGGVALYVREWTDCEELRLSNSHDQAGSCHGVISRSGTVTGAAGPKHKGERVKKKSVEGLRPVSLAP